MGCTYGSIELFGVIEGSLFAADDHIGIYHGNIFKFGLVNFAYQNLIGLLASFFDRTFQLHDKFSILWNDNSAH